MWFSEEAGNRVGRIAPDGTITEYPIPMAQANVILAGLAFDNAGNLWMQQYVDQNNPSPAGSDFIIRVDKSILKSALTDISKVPITFYKVPTAQTIMHRVVQGPDGNIWFTELGANKVGKLRQGP
jgi:virginiamycin B lyase